MKETTVTRIREFTRFYLPEFDLLGNRYLGSDYSATEARVLFEIYTNDGCTAAAIGKTLNLDKSYLSRVIRSHQSNGYLLRTPSRRDNRAYELHLTPKGWNFTEEFIRKSNEQVGRKIEKLTDAECRKLIAALNTVTELLGRE